jgi:hypothetical protein
VNRYDVGCLARRLTTGFYIRCAALELVRGPHALETLPVSVLTDTPPVGLIRRKDDTPHAYDWTHHLQAARWQTHAVQEVVAAGNRAAEPATRRTQPMPLRDGTPHDGAEQSGTRPRQRTSRRRTSRSYVWASRVGRSRSDRPCPRVTKAPREWHIREQRSDIAGEKHPPGGGK